MMEQYRVFIFTCLFLFLICHSWASRNPVSSFVIPGEAGEAISTANVGQASCQSFYEKLEKATK